MHEPQCAHPRLGAKRRLADAYDEAQERGELASQGGDRKVNLPKVKVEDVGLSYREIHEARQIRDAEEADPGIIRRLCKLCKCDGGRYHGRMGELTKFDSAVASLSGQFATIMSAPAAFIIVLGFISAGLWKFLSHHYAGRLATKDAQIEFHKERISEYERKAGATPDEAQARIEDLEERIAALQPSQRRLSEEQKAAIASALRGIAVSSKDIDLIFPLPSPEAAIYAQDFEEAFYQGGWQINADSMIAGHRLRQKGITLGVPDLANKSSIAEALSNGLTRANLQFNWAQDDHRDHARLYIDMAE